MVPTQPGRLAFGIIPWYSLIIVTAIAIGIFLCGREEKRLGLPKDTAIDSALWAIPLGIIGARLYYVAFSLDQFIGQPLIRVLYIWNGGAAIYGALLGGLFGIWILSRRRKISLLTLLDMFAPSVILAQAMGRWGNFFNMEAFGEIVTNPKWQFFPFAVFIPGSAGGTWHLATFFYESLWDLITFILLMAFRKRMKRHGDVFFWYLLLYGAGRAVVEGLRLDSLMWLNGTIRVSQWLSFVAMAAVFLMFVIRMKKNKGQASAVIASVLLLVHSFYLLYVSRNTPPPFVWPWLSIVVLLAYSVFLCLPALQKGMGRAASLVPFWLITAALAVFLVSINVSESTLLEKTLFVALISLSFPASALAVYPHTLNK